MMYRDYNGKTILITGGCGFIGSHLVRHLVINYSEYKIVNIDALTYAGNEDNIKDIRDKTNYRFIRADINDERRVQDIFQEYKPSLVIHLAAESHVDRSILQPDLFLKTNVLGTHNLLRSTVHMLENGHELLFFHISTDEVYGSIDVGVFDESSHYNPQSPYAVSKASSDMLVKAYHNTYGLPYIITNCSNNFGTHQYPEKMIPTAIISMMEGKAIPVYGDGTNVRDWLSVHDHVYAIDKLLHSAIVNNQFCIGSHNEWTNIDLVEKIIELSLDYVSAFPLGYTPHYAFVSDRKGHDYRYAINSEKLIKHTGWTPTLDFESELRKTIAWYIENADYWRSTLYKK